MDDARFNHYRLQAILPSVLSDCVAWDVTRYASCTTIKATPSPLLRGIHAAVRDALFNERRRGVDA